MSIHPGTADDSLRARGWRLTGSLNDIDGHVLAWFYEHPDRAEHEIQVNSDLHPVEPDRFIHTIASPGRLSRFEIGSGDASTLAEYLNNLRTPARSRTPER